MSILTAILLIIGMIGLLVLSFYMGKYKLLRLTIFGLAGIGLLGFSVFCVMDLNYYYNVKGGVYGVLNGIFSTNEAEQDNLTFSLKNIELTQDFENTYSATIMLNNSITIEDKNYEVFVNGVPCNYSEVDTAHAIGNYNYIFYDNAMKELLNDTLNFTFAFYKNYSTLKVTTYGGIDAVNNWNSYFNKNNFVVSIEESTKPTDNEMKVVEGNISNFRQITYYADNEIFYTTYFDMTKTIEWIKSTPIKEGCIFVGWSLDGENITNNLTSTKDIEVHAVFLTDNQVIFNGVKNFSTETLSSNYILDLNSLFAYDFSKMNFSVKLDAFVYSPDGMNVGFTNLIFTQNQSGDFVHEGDTRFNVNVSVDGQYIKINPSTYKSGYSYSLTIYEIIVHA